ncbi:MAG: DUF4194 domain-containing protein [Spirochaetales bacterium]|nr:DUF4194 domain-containing protein [Spirochaetales bacterium]
MKETKDFAPVVLQLLKGILQYEDKDWTDLLIHQRAVRAYFADIGLELHLNEADGYAYLAQPLDEEEEQPLPRLTRRIPLSFEVSLLCVLLREEMDAFEAGASEALYLYITLSDFREKLQVYFKENLDQIRLFRELDRYVRKVEELGLISQSNRGKENQEPIYRVSPLTKAKVSLEFIGEFKRKLEEHGKSL